MNTILLNLYTPSEKNRFGRTLAQWDLKSVKDESFNFHCNRKDNQYLKPEYRNDRANMRFHFRDCDKFTGIVFKVPNLDAASKIILKKGYRAVSFHYAGHSILVLLFDELQSRSVSRKLGRKIRELIGMDAIIIENIVFETDKVHDLKTFNGDYLNHC